MSTHRSKTRRHPSGPTSSTSSANPQGGLQASLTLKVRLLELSSMSWRRWADRNRCAWPGALKRFILRSRHKRSHISRQPHART
ncbi:MAG: hypothetical protein K0R61_5644 [Microvirga sp.]|jgi:hypothetical protein|nr:hypothetical protein [Microvirga sp.]